MTQNNLIQQLIGTSLGPYQIDTLLGEGASVSTFTAHPLAPQEGAFKEVILKVKPCQPADRPTYLGQQFLQAAQPLTQIKHENLAQILQVGYQGPCLYLAFEFIPGQTLRQYLYSLRAKNQWLPLTEALSLIHQISLAMQAGHEQGLYHGNIKPQNIILTPDPSQPQPLLVSGQPHRSVLTDLGLHQHFEIGLLDLAETPLGTLSYLAPERTQGKSPSVQSDIYALGVLLYELTVGQLPFPIQTLGQAIYYHTQQIPLPPQAIRPDLPDKLSLTLEQALAKNPAQRFASLQDFARSIADLLLAVETLTLKGEALLDEAAGEIVSADSPSTETASAEILVDQPSDSARPTLTLDPTLPLVPETRLSGPNLSHPPLHLSQRLSEPASTAPSLNPTLASSPPSSKGSKHEALLAPDLTQATKVYQILAELYPTSLQAGKQGQMSVYNRGAIPQTVRLEWQDPTHKLTFSPPQLTLKAPEQTRVKVNFRVRLQRRPLFGNVKPYPFSVQLTLIKEDPYHGEAQTLIGEVLGSGWLSMWVLITFLSMGIGILAAWLSVYGANFVDLFLK